MITLTRSDRRGTTKLKKPLAPVSGTKVFPVHGFSARFDISSNDLFVRAPVRYFVSRDCRTISPPFPATAAVKYSAVTDEPYEFRVSRRSQRLRTR